MQALRWTGPNKIEFGEIDEPAVREPGDVKVRVRHVGVCTTDFHIVEGSFGEQFPLTMGHEIAGEVAEAGAEVEGLHPGQPVVLQPTLFCGACPACSRGRIHLCPNRRFCGLNHGGGFAEFMVAPAVNWIPVDATLPLERVCLAEPLACVLHALDLLPPGPEQTVCLSGAGISAYLFVLALRSRATAAEQMLVSGLRDAPLRIIGETGVRTVDVRTEDVERTVRDHFGPAGPDVWIDMTGDAGVIDTGLHLVARQGVLFLYAYMPAPQLFDFATMQLAENRILTSTGAPNTIPLAAEMLHEGRIDPAPMVTHTHDMKECERGFRYAQSNPQDHVKSVIRFST
jgi:threonine dehydrogenase-like Zn-dependent dehydrogenase